MLCWKVLVPLVEITGAKTGKLVYYGIVKTKKYFQYWELLIIIALYFIETSVFFFAGVLLRRSSLDPDRRRLSLGTTTTHHRASDVSLDPHHAAILFRDSRGVSTMLVD